MADEKETKVVILGAVFQRHAIQILHGDERLPMLVVDLVDRSDIRMIERRCFGLPLEAAERL